jgi:carbon storage regulator
MRNGLDDSNPHNKTGRSMMVVLSRKVNQKVMIGGGIVVTVVKIDRNHVRLGFEAPATTSIAREEMHSGYTPSPPNIEPSTISSDRRPRGEHLAVHARGARVAGIVATRLVRSGFAVRRPNARRPSPDGENPSRRRSFGRALELLHQRAEEVDPAVQSEMLEQLKRSLDENRMSPRKLFP